MAHAAFVPEVVLMPRALLPLVFVLAACGENSSGVADEGLGTIAMSEAEGGIDTSERGLVAFVKERRYASWTAEPAIHQSEGPHGGTVRVFFSSSLVTSMREGRQAHPKGAVIVKELIELDGTYRGHAVDVKVKDGQGKDTWLFFEGFTDDDYARNYYGLAHETCHGCHSAGADYVLSKLP